MSPNRKTIIGWSLGTALIILIPILVLLGVSLSTQGNTEDIKATQLEAQEATAAAIRNGAVSSCQSTYAGTFDGWLAAGAAGQQPNGEPVSQRDGFLNALEMDQRRLGVAVLARHNPDDPFVCPPIPARLVIDPIDPRVDEPTPFA